MDEFLARVCTKGLVITIKNAVTASLSDAIRIDAIVGMKWDQGWYKGIVNSRKEGQNFNVEFDNEEYIVPLSPDRLVIE